MITANYSYYVDWGGDGSFGSPYADITAFVFDADWQYGRSYASQLSGKSQAGVCTINLDNSDSRFSPFNATSPIHGQILPGRQVRVTMQVGSELPVVMWQGLLEMVTPTPGAIVKVSTARLLAYGPLAARCLQQKVSVPMRTDITTGDAMNVVLDQFLKATDPPVKQFATGMRAIDTGQSTLSRWWTRETGMQALRDLEESETGFLRESKLGQIGFEDRAHRLSGEHTEPQAVYDGGEHGLVLWNIIPGDSSKGIFNHIEAAIHTFNVSDPMILWELTGAAILIKHGESVLVKAVFPGPLTASGYIAVSAWQTVDYEANSQDDGLGDDLTSHISATSAKTASENTLTFTNDGTADAYLTVCRCHGVAVVEGDTSQIYSEDTDSIATYGPLPYINPGKFLTDAAEAKDRCDHLLAIYKDPVPIIQFDLKANYDLAHLTEAQRRDVSDCITITALAPYGLYIDDNFFVESIHHVVDKAKLHTVSLVCSKVVTHDWPAGGNSYVPKTVSPLVSKPPDDLVTIAVANGLRLLTGIVANKWNAGITQAEFRALLLPPDVSVKSVDLRIAAEMSQAEIDSGLIPFNADPEDEGVTWWLI